MNKSLYTLLKNSAIVDKNIQPTHQSYYGPTSKWEIDNAKLTEFWKGYCELVGSDNDSESPSNKICLAEIPTNFMPIISTMIFKFHSDTTEMEMQSDDYYSLTFLKWLAYIYQKAIIDIFQLNTDNELICVILERSLGLQDGMISFEVRLQFPYAKIDMRHINNLEKKVIELLHRDNVVSKLTQQPIGDWQAIISSITDNPVITMYGSSEKIDTPILEMTHIFNHIEDPDNEEDELLLSQCFSPLDHDQVEKSMIEDEMFYERSGGESEEESGGEGEGEINFQKWLPMFLSVTFCNKLLILKKTIKHTKPASDSTFGDPKVFDDADKFLICQKMISMLNTERFTKEHFWLDIGKALYNIDKNADKTLALWIKATNSKISNLKDFMVAEGDLETTCKTIFNSLNNNNITYKTLAWYAKEDNPEKYAEWHKEWCRSSFETALNGVDTDVAEALYRVYWLEYACTSLTPPRWFHFSDNKWSPNDCGVSLRIAISSSFRGLFENARVQLARKISESSDEVFKSKSELMLKKLASLIKDLGTGRYKDWIMKEAKEKFHNPKFMSMLDKNAELTGVINGVLEIQQKDVIFRAAKPEDYITMSTGVKYEKLSYEHPLVKEALRWLEQTFPDEALRHHFLKFSASLLIGRNADKIFPIFTGEGGDNSKSMIVKLFEYTLGVYSIKFPVAMLTEKFATSSGPNPQLARAKGARIAFLDEPEDDVSLQKGTIKRYTGGDSFFARLLQDNGGEVEATFVMVLVCNKVPVIPNADKAIKKRTRLFPFLSTWSMNAPKSEAEQMKQRLFKMDPNFEKRIPKLASAFLWLMTQYYHVYAEEGLPDPEIITEYTDNYWRDNDVYAQFAAEKINEVYIDENMTERDANTRLSLTELYSEFKDWYTINFPKIKIPQRSFVKSEYQHRWGKMIDSAWLGIKIADETSMSAPISVGKKAPVLLKKRVD